MNNFYLDVCYSEEMADLRVAFHEEKERQKIKKRQVAAVVITSVKGDPDTPKLKTLLANESDNLWIVTAEESA